MSSSKTEFFDNTISAIKAIPRGKVATYGQVATASGREGAARTVSWILHSSSKKHKLPWHRVINSKGTISFERNSFMYSQQKRLLRKEGVVFDEHDRIDLKKYRYSFSRALEHA